MDGIELTTDPGRCPYCSSFVSPTDESATRCPRCKTPHHLECFKENGGCGVYACKPVPAVAGSHPPVPKKGADEKYCCECAAVIRHKAVICPQCGCPQPAYYPAPYDPTAPAPYPRGANCSRGVAAVLALFFGGFGAHKFYMGRPAMGLIYLILCFTGLPFLAGFMEGLSYLIQSDDEFRRQNF